MHFYRKGVRHLNMFPFQARNYAGYVLFVRAIFGGKFFLSDATGSIAGTNLSNLLLCKLCVGMRLAMAMALFLVHIGQIVLQCAKEQMGGVATTGIVALMQNMQIAIVAMSKQPSRLMRSPALVVNFDLAIPFAICVGLPFPTIIGAAPVYLLPKALSEWALSGWTMTADVFTLLAGKLRDGYGLTTAARAGFVLFVSGGMITHVMRSFSAFDYAAGCCTTAAAFCCVTPIIHE